MSTLVIGSGDEMFIIYGPHHPLYCANTSSSGPSTTSSSRATSASDEVPDGYQYACDTTEDGHEK